MAKRQDPPSFRAKRGSGTIEQIGGRWWWQRSRTVTNPDGTRARKRWREGPFPTRKAAEAARRAATPVSDEYARRLTWDETSRVVACEQDLVSRFRAQLRGG